MLKSCLGFVLFLLVLVGCDSGSSPSSPSIDSSVPDYSGGTSSIYSNSYSAEPSETSATITSVKAVWNPQTGKTLFTIRGFSFDPSDQFELDLDGYSFESQIFVSDSEFHCETSRSFSPGEIHYIYVSGDANGFRWNKDWPPTYWRLTPKNGHFGSTTTVTMAGNFSSSAKVSLGQYSCQVTTGSATCVVPGTEPIGSLDLLIIAEDGQRLLQRGAFQVLDQAPVITSVSPSRIPEAGGTVVNVYGSNLVAGNVSLIRSGVYLFGVPVTVVSRNQVTFTAPQFSGSGPAQFFLEFRSLADNQLASATGPTYISPPLVKSVSKVSVNGEQIQIHGTFDRVTSVRIENLPCSNLVVTPTQLTCDAPAMSQTGSKSLDITDDVGQVYNSWVDYVFPPPVISQVVSSPGPLAGGTEIRILGSEFHSPQVFVGGQSCGNLLVVSENEIRCTSPSASRGGSASIEVVNSGGRKSSPQGGHSFSYIAPPELFSASPQDVQVNTEEVIELDGYFAYVDQVFIEGQTVQTLDTLPRADHTRIRLRTPSIATYGRKEIRVTDQFGQSSTLYFRVIHPLAQVDAVSPAYGAEMGNTPITITGRNFDGARGVSIGNKACSSVRVRSSSEITCVTPMGVGNSDLRVFNADDSAGNSIKFRYVKPPSGSFSPTSGGSSDEGKIVFSGNVGDVTEVTLTSASGQSKLCRNLVFHLRGPLSGKLECVTPVFEELGSYVVSAVDIADQRKVWREKFLITGPSPILDSITPQKGSQLGGTQITLTGRNFNSPSVTIGGQDCKNIQVISPQELRCTTPQPRTRFSEDAEVTVINGDGNRSSELFFFYLPPIRIQGVSPSSLSAENPGRIQIVGSFGELTSITINGVACTNITLTQTGFASNSPDRVECDAPRLNVGQAVIVVKDDINQEASFSILYKGQPPTILRVEPATVQVDTRVELAIHGNHFSEGATVKIGSSQCTGARVSEDGSTIRCQFISSEDGDFTVEVTNPDLQKVRINNMFRIPAPPASVSAISPTRGSTQGNRLVLIRGRKFKVGTQVKVGTYSCGYVRVYENAIACLVGPGNPGRVDVKVQIPGGQELVLENGFEYVQAQDIQQLHLNQLGSNNSYGGVDQPINQFENVLLKDVISLGIKKGPHIYSGFEVDKILSGIKLKYPIKRGNSLSPSQIATKKRNFLATQEVSAIGFGKLLEYFDDFFPVDEFRRRGPRAPNDPLYFNPNLLVDFSFTGPDGLPVPLSQLTVMSPIRAARDAIKNAVSYANSDNYPNAIWHLDLKYYLKRVLLDLENTQDIDRKKLAVRVMVSVGLHCGPGNLQGAQVLKDILFPGDEFSTQNQSTWDVALATLDGMREEVFNRVSDFIGDTQTAHTKLYYRGLMSDILSIQPGPTDDPFSNVANRPINQSEFKKRFFKGQIGSSSSISPDGQRSYEGYTKRNVLRKVIELFQDIQFTTDYYNEVLSTLDDVEAVAWGKQHTREVLEPMGYYHADDEPGNIEMMDDPSFLGHIKYIYFKKFFHRENGNLGLTTDGIRKALVDFEVFETDSTDSGNE